MNKIAVIDDNMVFRRVTKMLLKKIGTPEDDILLFDNGKEIHDFLEVHKDAINTLPQIMFLDLNMPIMNGWDFLKSLQIFKSKYNYNPKIYVLTSSVDDKDYKSVLSITKVEGYIIKPVDKNILTRIISTY